jgi:hypothetical protein
MGVRVCACARVRVCACARVRVRACARVDVDVGGCGNDNKGSIRNEATECMPNRTRSHLPSVSLASPVAPAPPPLRTRPAGCSSPAPAAPAARAPPPPRPPSDLRRRCSLLRGRPHRRRRRGGGRSLSSRSRWRRRRCCGRRRRGRGYRPGRRRCCEAARGPCGLPGLAPLQRMIHCGRGRIPRGCDGPPGRAALPRARASVRRPHRRNGGPAAVAYRPPRPQPLHSDPRPNSCRRPRLRLDRRLDRRLVRRRRPPPRAARAACGRRGWKCGPSAAVARTARHARWTAARR